MTVRFVYFDAGFTLIRPHPSVGYHYARAAEEWGNQADAGALDATFGPAWKTVRRKYAPLTPVPYGCTEAESLGFWSDVVRETFRAASMPLPEDEGFLRDVFYRFESGECWKVYEDVEETLELLINRGVWFGVMSNWDARLHGVLRDLGLSGRLSALVLSCEVRAEKPAKAIFEAAARRAGLQPGEIALIGDEIRADGEGAIRAGWKQCLVRRPSASPPPDGMAWAPTLVEAVGEVLGGRE